MKGEGGGKTSLDMNLDKLDRCSSSNHSFQDVESACVGLELAVYEGGVGVEIAEAAVGVGP
jgi:hypothetical protein